MQLKEKKSHILKIAYCITGKEHQLKGSSKLKIIQPRYLFIDVLPSADQTILLSNN
jgi:hypothetical protein